MDASIKHLEIKIVIVDDYEGNLMALEVQLESIDCEKIKFTSAKKALEYLVTNQVAVIITDVKMPIMDGFDFAKRVRRIESASNTPIIFFSGLDQSSSYIDELYEAGGVDFISKPINTNVLRTKVKFFIEMFLKTKQLERNSQILTDSVESEKTRLLENALDAVVGIDENNLVTFWNRNAEVIFGWSKEEMLQNQLSVVIPERLREAHLAGMKRFVSTGIAKIQNQRIEIPGLRKNGDEFIMELTVSAVQSDRGYRFYSFMRDISEQKRTELNLHQRETERVKLLDVLKLSEKRSNVLSNASRVLNSTLDIDKILFSLSETMVPDVADFSSIRMINPEGDLNLVTVSHQNAKKVEWAWDLEKRFPPNPDSLFGPYQVVRTGKPDLMNNISDDMIAAGSDNKEKIELIKSVGLRSYICAPINSRGRIVGTITLVTTDESARHYSAEDLILAVELGNRIGVAVENVRLYKESLAANRLKDEFLANLSHELRTPMNVILGHANILKSEFSSLKKEEILQSIEAIDRNAVAQTAIISDLLDVSSIITGKVVYKPEEIKPAETIKQILESLQPTAKAKSLTLEFFTEDAPKKVYADITRLHQIVWNLISNAIKFTNAGGLIKVVINQADNNWIIGITDNGLGIEKEFLPFVFDRFRQQDASTTRKFGGLGLGLSVVRHLVELHGGYVTAESDGKGKGATFKVVLPLKPMDFSQVSKQLSVKAVADNSAVARTAASRSLNNVKILLVEDSLDSRVLVKIMLSKAGAQVIEANSAEEARHRLLSYSPDVILSDIGMPDEDGIQFMKKLRVSCSIPAIALTAFVRPEEQKLILEAGFQLHLSKPTNRSDLTNGISKLLSLSH